MSSAAFWWTFVVEGLVISVIGSLLHFVYEWTGRRRLVAVFAAVNESTWEHIKLALSSIFLCTLVDIWFFGDNPNYWLAKSASLLMPIVIIPLIFYSYTHFTKKPILPIDIGSFVVASFLASLAFVVVLKLPPVGVIGGVVSAVICMIMIAAILLLTKFPLRGCFLFEDPITHEYGYEGQPRYHKKHKHKNKGQQRQPKK